MYVKFKNRLSQFVKVIITTLDDNSFIRLKDCNSHLNKYGFCLSPYTGELKAPVILKKGFVYKRVDGMAKLYIDLHWINNSEAAVEQRIEWKRVPNGAASGAPAEWETVATVDAGDNSYTHAPAVTTETELTYRVVSVGDVGEVASQPVVISFPPPLVAPNSLMAAYRYEIE